MRARLRPFCVLSVDNSAEYRPEYRVVFATCSSLHSAAEDDVHARTITTGQRACCARSWLTEPSISRFAVPRPRDPTTSSSAPRPARGGRQLARPLQRQLRPRAAPPSTARGLHGALPRHGVRRDERVGRRREGLTQVAGGRRLPGTDNPEQGAAQLRLVGCEPKSGLGLARAVDADDDHSGRGPAHSSDPCASASVTRWVRCGLRPGTASDAATLAASTPAMTTKVVV